MCTVNVRKRYKPIPSGSTMATFHSDHVSAFRSCFARDPRSRSAGNGGTKYSWGGLRQSAKQRLLPAIILRPHPVSLPSRERRRLYPDLGGAGRWEPLASVLPAHTVPRADRGPLIAAVRVFVAGVPALLASAEDRREVVVRKGLRPQREIGDGERWALRRCHGIKRKCTV
jgi:hypothetical protein